ncbi:DUF1905 domain-containing protein [Kibdelosporangium phytohabitans]|uniref:DUF1905 domain-containing protein n=1 Tax=Kibdelosporangium phytohabitans TaxID=860235 RepID=A0A0N9I9H8_9PSEU|nr:DUF1905 domain-containing protein [Kibdelosporangium phytohabitans]ALG11145.1 hypothetical protein AOZ06_33485 [Kibdelosporangium phytohabitans]MBE1462398.1 hypothetical protein [Kibdelosporangium phytohabitans]
MAETSTLDKTFTAAIVADANSNWPCVQMPGSAEFFGTGNAVKVSGTVDGHDYQAAMLPIGGGVHMMPLRAPFRKLIGKGLGDEVTVHLTQRLS